MHQFREDSGCQGPEPGCSERRATRLRRLARDLRRQKAFSGFAMRVNATAERGRGGTHHDSQPDEANIRAHLDEGEGCENENETEIRLKKHLRCV